MQKSELTLVGLAAGSLNTLTLHGLSSIKDADLIVYETGLDSDIRALWSDRSREVKLPQNKTIDSLQIESNAVLIAEAMGRGLKVVRLSLDKPILKKCLDLELKILRRMGIGLRIVPSLHALEQEAWDLRLPWLSDMLPSPFRIIQSPNIKGDQAFWQQLAEATDTLTLDLGSGQLGSFIDRLLVAGADPERPVALVAHHPTQSPLCWLTTLEEVDELLSQWKPEGATIVYIGTWPHILRDLEPHKSFWGSLEAAAEIWLKAQRA